MEESEPFDLYGILRLNRTEMRVAASGDLERTPLLAPVLGENGTCTWEKITFEPKRVVSEPGIAAGQKVQGANGSKFFEAVHDEMSRLGL